MTAADWAVVIGGGGGLGIVGVLMRISWQISAFVSEFRAYVKLNDLVVDKLDNRVVKLEQRRR